MLQGERIRITAMHADGETYRWWRATVEEAGESRLVAYAPAGEVIHEAYGPRTSRVGFRTVFWLDLTARWEWIGGTA